MSWHKVSFKILKELAYFNVQYFNKWKTFWVDPESQLASTLCRQKVESVPANVENYVLFKKTLASLLENKPNKNYKIKKCERLILLKALTELDVNFAANFQYDCHSAGIFNKNNPKQF